MYVSWEAEKFKSQLSSEILLKIQLADTPIVGNLQLIQQKSTKKENNAFYL